MVARGTRYKADYIWESPDDGQRYEVIEGELHVSPAPSWQHQRGLNRLNVRVAQHVFERGLGDVVTAPVGVALDDENGVQPDLVYISRERAHQISARGIEGAPDLVAEMLSPSTQAVDRGKKLERYAKAGIPHYWIVSPWERTLEAYRLVAGEYEPTGTFGPGSVFRPDLFPGLEIPIDDLWA